MIRISLGNVGSGKTLMEVREMFLDRNKRRTFTNIKTSLSNCKLIDSSMIVKKTPLKTKRSGEMVYDMKLNIDFWKNIKEPINIVLDEAHAVMNPRRSASKQNIIITDWIALIRRVLGQSESGEGQLVLITQLPNRLDVIAREMATQIRYYVCHYIKSCDFCHISWSENSEHPEPLLYCPQCKRVNIKKHSHIIEVWHFSSMEMFYHWKFSKLKTYHKHYLVKGIEKYFTMYDTLQWDNLFSDY